MLKKILLLSLLAVFLNARVVIDSEGKEIALPDKVELVSPMVGIFVQISVSLGNEDKIYSAACRGLSPMMMKIFPQIQSTGMQCRELGVNVESLIKAKTQVIFGPSSAMFDDNIIKQLERAGIAVVRMKRTLSSVKELKERVSEIAEIFGDESVKKAKEFNAYFDENIAFVRSRLPKNAYKKRVLVLNYRSGNWASIATNNIGAEYIRLAGGQNLTSQKVSAWGSYPSINEEQIIVYNPDIIITDTKESLDKILKNPSLKELKAIQSKQIFIQPRGAVYFWAGTEGALQVLWLAKTLHPNEFKELDMGAKVREFYERFYRYKLSDEELTEILNPKEKIRVIY